ncbi:MAG: riboflavin synthase [Deltaproteobacteria bacterium]|nr:riboflavin synthase [Deltaproteobacteria bacterium]
MFTGIIQACGIIKSVEKKGESGRIVVTTELDLEKVGIGDSIAVDGVCLTVVSIGSGAFTAEMSGETLGLTTLGELTSGAKVNLEPPLTPTAQMGGHIVTGHVDGVGTISKREVKGGFAELEVSVPGELSRQIVKKGSIAVDGISLTVVREWEGGFSTTLIPHTMNETTLAAKRGGSRVNIETDIIAKYVERFTGSYHGREVTEELLRKHGF